MLSLFLPSFLSYILPLYTRHASVAHMFFPVRILLFHENIFF